MIRDGRPFRSGHILLIKGLCRPLPNAKETVAGIEPVNIEALRFAIHTPDQPGVRWIIVAMNRRRCSELDEVTGVIICRGPAVPKLQIKLRDVIVFFLICGREKKFLAN